MAVKNGLIRFATKGFRAQRLNPDGTIPRPGRAVGFASTVNLAAHTSNGMAELTIKVGLHEPQTRALDFSGAVDLSRVTVSEAASAINAAGFTDVIASLDERTGRLLLGAGGLVPAKIGIRYRRPPAETEPQTYPLNRVPLTATLLDGNWRFANVTGATEVTFGQGERESALIELEEIDGRPLLDSPAIIGSLVTSAAGWNTNNSGTSIGIPGSHGITLRAFVPSSALPGTNSIIQIVGPLASALDFGQGRRHGGDLRCLSFFNDTTMSITLPKDIIEREEIDIEGANGSQTRMVIGARMQGKSPVITMKEKNYDLLQLVQGGRLNRATGEYDPPMPNEIEHPLFLIETFGPVYGQGANRQDDVKGYERILLRNCMGWEGDVPIEAKKWAQYAYNIAAIEYSDENGVRFPAWQERHLSIAQFDELRVNDISMTEDELGNNVGVSENLGAAESRGAPAAVAPAAVQPARGGVPSPDGTGLEGLPGDWSSDD